ncbi:GPI mannosyltransferase 1, partial [Teleopsis dalmanni]|uniref:GPI mannosyltransferase 1 n=1 Tax=Teleopsis dalmanni TaxID=139649 RepID=UPI0018CF2AE4
MVLLTYMKKCAARTTNQLNRTCVYLMNCRFRTHLLIAFIIRLALIYYGYIQDKRSEVPYTDIDYKVVTDGARYVLDGNSPFDRHTYRYSPILAYLQMLNIWIHMACGKVIYAIFDITVSFLIYKIIRAEQLRQSRKGIQTIKCQNKEMHLVNSCDCFKQNKPSTFLARASAYFWLYNPLTLVISTRGNGDSISSVFVILTIYLLSRSQDLKRGRNWMIFAAGLCHGFSIHLRLYPIVFSLAYYLSLSEKLINSTGEFFRQIILPSSKQLTLIFGTILGFSVVSVIFYHLYGWQYIYEAYLYHFVRKDVRHNFSLYFLMQYLGSNVHFSIIEKLTIIIPQLCLILYLSISFGQFLKTLPFCIFSLSFIIVTFNSVVTSQYFVWYMAALPLCLKNFKKLSLLKAILYFSLWLLGQGMWLLPAYLLEFKTYNTFYWIGAQSAVFFLVNSFILIRLIE